MTKTNFGNLAKVLNQLACKECTRGWLSDHDNSSEPIEDILNCFEKGLITYKLKNRLIKEVKEINEEN